MRLNLQFTMHIRRMTGCSNLNLTRRNWQEIADCWSFIPDFVNEKEESDLINDLDKLLKNQAWHLDHFDSAIFNYRELSLSNLNKAPNLKALIETRINPIFEKLNKKMLPVHVLELRPGGLIRPHVDNPEVLSIYLLYIMSFC